MTLYLSRLRLLRDPSIEALKALLQPRDAGQATDANHRLIWSAFACDPGQNRDFLWRAEGNGVFHVLSPRRPMASPFFEPPEIKPFAPDLAPGDRLEFILRANATKTRKSGRMTASGKEHKQHIDIVMDALFALPSGRQSDERAEARMKIARQKGAEWLQLQGARAGFTISERGGEGGPEPDMTVTDYSVMALPSHTGARQGQPQFGIMDMTGTITITDPSAFLAKLPQGFGRAKAFGCGLMMIRRKR